MFLLCSYAQPKPLSLNIWYARSLRDKPLADYVGYVQAQWQDEKDLRRLDRMLRQMVRVEEIRSASQFVQGAWPEPASEPEQAAPLSLAEQIDTRAAALGVARSLAQAEPAELAAVQNLLSDLRRQIESRRAGFTA